MFLARFRKGLARRFLPRSLPHPVGSGSEFVVFGVYRVTGLVRAAARTMGRLRWLWWTCLEYCNWGVDCPGQWCWG